VPVHRRVMTANSYKRFGEKWRCLCQLRRNKRFNKIENRLLQHLISKTNVIAELKKISSTDEFSLLQFG